MTFDWTFGITKAYEEEGDLFLEGNATIESMDSQDEIVEFDSVQKSFDRFMTRSPVLCVHHDITKPVGQIIKSTPKIENDIKKMFVRARVDKVSNPTSYVNETRELIKSGTLRYFSIRGKPKRRWVTKGIKHVSVDRIIEVSVVAAGAHEDTLFNVVSKSMSSDIDNNPEVDTMDEQVLKSALGSLKDDLLKEIDNRMDAKIDAKFEGITKSLTDIQKSLPEVPDEEEIAFNKKVNEEVKKIFADKEQVAEVLKAVGGPPDNGNDSKDEKELIKNAGGHVGLEQYREMLKAK